VYTALAGAEDQHWWFRGRRAIAAHIIERLALPADATILEVGSGTGGNLEMLSRFGRLFATELDTEARAFSDRRGIVKAEKGILPHQIPFGDRRFDLIAAFDVLEHLDADFETLVALHARLVDQGKLLITVPAFPFLWSAHDESHHHKRRYRLRPLVRLFERAGYRVLLASYCNFWLFPLVAAARLPDRFAGTGRQKRIDLPIPPAPLNDLLEKIFSSERYLHGIVSLPFGVSIVLLAQRCGANNRQNQLRSTASPEISSETRTPSTGCAEAALGNPEGSTSSTK
jgi:SAM-dependent methyltransferase